jgi:hypothetical protein
VVSIDSGPSGPTLNEQPTFSFSADERVEFACRMTGTGISTPGFSSCTGPGQTFSSAPLADGAFTFEVRATDAAGNESFATRGFRVSADECRAAVRASVDGAAAVDKAEKKLAKAKKSGDRKKIRKAKKALKKAQAQAQVLADDVDRACGT